LSDKLAISFQSQVRLVQEEVLKHKVRHPLGETKYDQDIFVKRKRNLK